MAKTSRTLRTPLPTYEKDRQEWRKKILANVRKAASRAGVQYHRDDHFQVEVLLYLKKGKRHDIHDVDNRLKDILDALQGRFRGFPSSKRRRLIDNDNKICRAIIEKRPTPKTLINKKTNTGGKIVIKPYNWHP